MATVLAVGLGVGLSGTTALAASESANDETVITSDMVVTDIDVKQARKAGNRVVTEGDYRVLLDGKTGQEIARVPKKNTAGDVSVQNYVTGNCGTSYIYLRDASGANFYFYTGFDLNGSAVDFDWYVNVRGEHAGGIDNFEWEDHGPLAWREAWTSGNIYSSQDLPYGSWYYARVTSGTAYLSDGRVCYSGQPSSGRYLYK